MERALFMALLGPPAAETWAPILRADEEVFDTNLGGDLNNLDGDIF